MCVYFSFVIGFFSNLAGAIYMLLNGDPSYKVLTCASFAVFCGATWLSTMQVVNGANINDTKPTGCLAIVALLFSIYVYFAQVNFW